MGDDALDTKAVAAPYIEEMAIELAALARKDGLSTLAYVLEMAAAEARNRRVPRRYRPEHDTD